MNPYRIAQWIVRLWWFWAVLGLIQWRVTEAGGPWWATLALFGGAAFVIAFILGILLLLEWIDMRADAWDNTHN